MGWESCSGAEGSTAESHIQLIIMITNISLQNSWVICSSELLDCVTRAA